MGNKEAATIAWIAIASLGFLMADGERRRIKWVQAMRRCLIRIGDAIRYERKELSALLRDIDFSATQQEKELSRILHACAEKMREKPGELSQAFSAQCVRCAAFGVVSREDAAPFEAVLGELGCCGLREQLRLIEEADERLRQREEKLRKESGKRSRLLSSLGLCSGAAVFLVLI